MIHADVDSEVDIQSHHGQLRPVIGIKHYEVVHADRTACDLEKGPGWTFHNAPTMAYWNDRFYLQYIANPVGENIPPSRTMLTMSDDGRRWSEPRIVFPTYRIGEEIPDREVQAGELYAVMHHRMGFYLAPNGKLLTLGFYGISPEPSVMPNNGKGIGRVVREIGQDGSLGPIYFIRYNRHAGWKETNTAFPPYAESTDAAFVEACESCLSDRLVTMQWWEEEQNPDGVYPIKGCKAMSSYRIDDRITVGLWKWGKCSISYDKGESWSPVQDIPSLNTAGSKIWGQKLSDHTYAIVYNPNPWNEYRWPLAIMTSRDGLDYSNIGLVQGEVPVRRYAGYYKFFGINYVKGVEVGNERLKDLWLSYSMNKEDIWVSRIPVPIRYANPVPVHDLFYAQANRPDLLDDWNLYIPRFTDISIDEDPITAFNALHIQDRNPYDFAKAERSFPASTFVDIHFSVMPGSAGGCPFIAEFLAGKSNDMLSVRFEADGFIHWRQGDIAHPVCSYEAWNWYDLQVNIDLENRQFSLAVNDGEIQKHPLTNPFSWTERMAFRTGDRDAGPTLSTKLDQPDQATREMNVPLSSYYIRYVKTMNHKPVQHDL
jgi:hypothetical protein